MMSVTFKAWAVAVFLAFPLLETSANAEPITVVADEWPPFSGEDLRNQGISLDVISTVLRRAGYEVTTEILPWARIMDGSRRGEFDIVGSLFFDPEIASYMTYGDPFYTTQVRFARQAGSGHVVTGLDSLQGHSIAVGDGFLYEENFDRADDLNKVVVTTALQGLQMVAYGRADLTLDSVEVMRYSVQNGDPDIAEKIEYLPYVLAENDIHMAVWSDLPRKDQVIADFNRTLAEMRADGSLDTLLSRHAVE